MKISIVIPFYNEEEIIPNLKRELMPVVKELRKEYEVELVFVDDGSTDKTVELLKKEFGSFKDLKLIKHEKNKNLGAAMRTGFKNASGDLIAVLDADCTFSPKLLFEFLKEMDSETDIVIASPYHPMGKFENVPFYRRFLSRGISIVYGLVLGEKIYSFTSIARLYRKKVIKEVKFESNGFLAVSELLIYAILKGFKVKEIPALLKTREGGDSKMNLVGEIINHGLFALKVFFLRLFKRVP